jgi:hypothetical protein
MHHGCPASPRANHPDRVRTHPFRVMPHGSGALSISGMLVALLAVLGVDLIVIVALVALVVSRKRWVRRQPGAFAGRIRTADGEVDGIGPKWRRGYGRWVGDVFVWTKAPLLLRNELVPVDALVSERASTPEELKRLGDDPVVIELRTGTETVEVATSAEDRDLLRGPYESSADVTASG